MRRSHAAVAFLICTALPGVSAGAYAADNRLGAFLAGTCATCHQGKAAGAVIPALGRRNEAELVAIMKAFRAGERPEPIMQAIATSLDDSELAALSSYLASLEP